MVYQLSLYSHVHLGYIIWILIILQQLEEALHWTGNVGVTPTDPAGLNLHSIPPRMVTSLIQLVHPIDRSKIHPY